jgi:putative transcriptional regulator
VRSLLAERAGLEISSASVSPLFSKKPAQVKLSTFVVVMHRAGLHPERLFNVDAAACGPGQSGIGLRPVHHHKVI